MRTFSKGAAQLRVELDRSSHQTKTVSPCPTRGGVDLLEPYVQRLLQSERSRVCPCFLFGNARSNRQLGHRCHATWSIQGFTLFKESLNNIIVQKLV